MNSEISLFVLAAGMGSRYGGLKQMEGFGPSGETIIDYSIYDAVKSGFNKIVFVIKPEMEEAFKEIFLSKYEDKIDIRYCFQTLDMVPNWYHVNPERVKPWGTGHALLVAREKINEPVLIINGDDFYGRGSFQVSAKFLREECSENSYCLPAYRLKNVMSDYGGVKRGVCKVKGEYLTDIEETFEIFKNRDGSISGSLINGTSVDLNPTDLISMNMFGVHPLIFGRLQKRFNEFLKKNEDELMGEFLLSNVFGDMIKDGDIKMKVLESDEEWFGVTYKEDGPIVREKLMKLVKDGVYPSPLTV